MATATLPSSSTPLVVLGEKDSATLPSSSSPLAVLGEKDSLSKSLPAQQGKRSHHSPHHTPLPTSTNYPTSPYHQPKSPTRRSIARPISPCPRSTSPCHGPVDRRRHSSYVSIPSFMLDCHDISFTTSSTTTTTNATSTLAGSGLHRSGSPPQHIGSSVFSNDRKTQIRSKNLQCGLCVKNFKDARILPCFHSFCACCLESSCLQKGENGKIDSVYCPICTEVTELSSKGIQGLPKNMYVDHLIVELQDSSFDKQIDCDLCIGNELAMSRCENCRINLCEFCTRAHQKQRKTSFHRMFILEDEPVAICNETDLGLAGGKCVQKKVSVSGRKILYCEVHSEEVVKSYCDDCEIPLCDECISLNHTQHNRSSLLEANVQYSELLRGLLSRARPLATSLHESIKNIGFISSSIQERTQSISDEIIDFISSQMKVLQEHKRLLLLQLDAVKNQKANTLMMQLSDLNTTLCELETSCNIAQQALDEGIPSVVFSESKPIASRLEEIVTAKQELSPKEDNYIQFHGHLPAQQCNGFPMFGVLDSKGPSAAQTIVKGEGLHKAWEGKSTRLKIVVHDRYKQRREIGGDKIEASMVNKRGVVVYMFIKDCKDGSYDISYIPESIGGYQLSLLVEGKHIKGSPFVVNVLPNINKHSGVFHCCTYCSSGGKKHVKCGCGSAMPGGYSGCGHGRPGHPGCHHWSCCGNTRENSDCL